MPLLLVISGPPGVGKSTVVDAIAARRPATRLSIDDVEEAMRACGIADADTGVAAYEVVRAAAEQNLALGADVIVDAVNDSEPARETWVRAARATGAELVVAVLELGDRAAHRARLEGRVRPFERIPEPAWTAVEALIARSAPWGPEVLRLDAALPPDELARSALAQVPPRIAPSGSE
ncbi:AAA family ATPase [Amnibacterium kyonggiense]|uniref:Putative kinase n=1 Tax=Amnibacterium kyonggiense TaxID=595671 RepID=A0A4R7FG44_9MICO|nr:ATP-binding protein [Amnibacterium kyonggiense]TDS75890.1 putative kinase [Amnibacterium kyonggiense]